MKRSLEFFAFFSMFDFCIEILKNQSAATPSLLSLLTLRLGGFEIIKNPWSFQQILLAWKGVGKMMKY